MDKKKQIEEMAKDIKASLTHHLPKTILYPYIAQDMYALGYRKIPEGAVVLTVEEYKEMVDDVKVSKEKLARIIDSAKAKARKETAREIFDKAKQKCKELEEKFSHLCKSKRECLEETCRYEGVLAVKREIAELAKQYGGEVEK